MKLIVTIDVEEDSGPDWVSPPTSSFLGITHGLKNILCPMFRDLGVVPTLFISPIVMQHRESVDVLAAFDQVELGAHLHWEQIAPHVERTLRGGPQLLRHMQWDFPPDQEREKLAAMTAMFVQQFGKHPTSFRAGRYGASPATGAILRDLGYIVDSSVTPHVKWKTPNNNFVDYTHSPEQPYFISANGNIHEPGDSSFLEVPITIMAKENFPGLNQAPWLRPAYASPETMKQMVRMVYERNQSGIEQPLVMMFHNVEVIPNASPYTRTAADVDAYLRDMRSVLEYARELGFTSCGLSDYAREAASRIKNNPKIEVATPQHVPSPQVSIPQPRLVVEDRLPRILFCVDAPHWAHDFKTNNIIANLPGRFDFRKVYQEHLTAEDLAWADIVIIYYWMQLSILRPLLPLLMQKIVLCGISCPTDLEDDRRDIGMNILRRFAGIFVHNKLLYDEYKPQFSTPVYLNQNGVDTHFYVPGTAPRDGHAPLIVGWAGSLLNHGNKRGYHDIIVPAVEQTPGVVLRTAAREEKWRGVDEMKEFYQSLDAYIVASRTEGTPNPGLESAACGVPVISTAVGNMPELIRDGENGFIFERRIDALAARLAYLRDNRALLDVMRHNIRHDILAWDWSIRAQAYGQMIEQTLALHGWTRQNVQAAKPPEIIQSLSAF